MSAWLASPLFAEGVSAFEVYRHLVLWLFCWIIPAACITTTVYLLISLPQRRRERARFFLDLLWIGFRTGRTPEATIVSAAQTKDRSPGVRFHLLAAHLESGMRLGAALDRVPRLLPPTLRGLIQAGEKAGRLREVVDLAREFIKSAATSESIGYPAVILLILLPFQLVVFGLQRIWVVPKLMDIFTDFEIPIPAFSAFFLGRLEVSVTVFGLFFLAILFGGLLFAGGPRVSRWFQPLTDWLGWHLPWVRARLRAQFAALLGLLLDAGLPESEAVLLAARSTANRVWLRRAERVLIALSKGERLTQALVHLDKSKELQWRVTNAATGARGGFWRALRGWQESLNQRAQQQAQAAMQVTTAGLIITNGLLVGVMAASVFLIFIEMIQAAVLW